jgi:hypothetical protein
MDPKEKDYDANALLAELRESLKNINNPTESITLTPNTDDTIIFNNMNSYDYGISAQDTITIASPSYSNSVYNNTVIGGGFTFGSARTNGTYTINSGATGANSPWATTNTSTKIQLEGEDADIVVNGHSLVDAINSIKDRLNCLQINPALEKEWEELRVLGDQYRELEKQILEKQAIWDRLKAMPPPEPLY